MTVRPLRQIIPAAETSDGAGVRLRRSLGQSQLARLDPFLMLDEFSSDDATDYIAGFPAHPHRGFETVTYIIDGHMLHEDHLGNRGDLQSGGVQWMTAGRGIIHSEMPQQREGLLRGFQLWINLPAREKMKPAAYRDIQSEDIPQIDMADGRSIRVIAGTLRLADRKIAGPVQGSTTEPLYLDVHLPPDAPFEHPVDPAHNTFIYPFEGDLMLGEPGQAVAAGRAALTGEGDSVKILAGKHGSRFLLLAGRPIGEPVAQYGPFVMNTREELEQALRDYQDGTLTAS